MSQVCFSLSVFSFLPVDSLHSSRAASVAILPSALLVERFSLGAWWAFPIQLVLLPDISLWKTGKGRKKEKAHTRKKEKSIQDRHLRRPLASPVLWAALPSRLRRASLCGYCAVVRTQQLVSWHFSLLARQVAVPIAGTPDREPKGCATRPRVKAVPAAAVPVTAFRNNRPPPPLS
jgi:hypothetical protein